MMDGNGGYHQNSDCSAHDYLVRASEAVETGNFELGMHLYMAAYERSQQATLAPGEEFINGLREAWVLACQLEERSIAEYIFEKLEPYLTTEEIKACADELQKLAFGRLEEIGLSADDIADIAHVAAREFIESDELPPVRIGRIDGPFPLKSDGMLDLLKLLSKQRTHEAQTEREEEPLTGDETSSKHSKKREEPDFSLVEKDVFTYADVAGYSETIKDMRMIGIGLDADPTFQDFISTLNARHGLKRMPALDSLLFRSPAREDANEFMLATAGEIGHPAVRMRVDENMQGIPVLSVFAQADAELRLNASRTMFEGRGTLVLEDIDLWLPPMPEPDDGLSAMFAAQFARAAREALSVIRTAVENPDIHVLASASTEVDIPSIFLDLLDPFTCVDVDLPTPGERADIWLDLVERHPSLRQVDRALLVRYTAHMPRVDIYFAVREAIEESYRRGVIAREYIPVTNELMFEKLSNFHPLDSSEYKELEEYVVGGFRRQLDTDKTVDMFLGLDWDEEDAGMVVDGALDFIDGGNVDSCEDACAFADAEADEGADADADSHVDMDVSTVVDSDESDT